MRTEIQLTERFLSELDAIIISTHLFGLDEAE
jgi:hypothetical protein